MNSNPELYMSSPQCVNPIFNQVLEISQTHSRSRITFLWGGAVVKQKSIFIFRRKEGRALGTSMTGVIYSLYTLFVRDCERFG